MTDFKKLKIKQYPHIQEKETSEVKYWKFYNNIKYDKHFSAPSCISFDPSGSGYFLVTASTKVSLYDPSTDAVQRTFSRFQDDCYSAKFRQDGKLFIASDKNGHIKIIDVYNKSILRILKGHSVSVRSCCWGLDNVHMFSGSDDSSVKFWDLGTGSLLWENKTHHNDYIRSVDSSPVNSNLFISGSYDHTIALWDIRMKYTNINSMMTPTTTQQNPVMSFNGHNQPISQCMFSPSGGLIIAASGNQIKIWDIVKGGFNSMNDNDSGGNNCESSCLHTFQNHTKNITSISLDATHTRLLSTGLDGHLKIYNLPLMTYVYGLKCSGGPLMAAGMSYDNKKIVLGYVDGTLEIKNKKEGTSFSPIGEPGNSTTIHNKNVELHKALLQSTNNKVSESDKLIMSTEDDDDNHIGGELAVIDIYKNPLDAIQQQNQLDNVYKHQNARLVAIASNSFYKGAGLSTNILSNTDFTIETERSAKLKNYEKYLKKFQYAQSLDHAIQSRNPLIVMTIFEELFRRNGLYVALSARNDASLYEILSFIIRYINNPRYSKLLINVTHTLLDIYSNVIGHSEAIDELFIKLKKFVYSEITLQKQLLKCMNMLDAIINASLVQS